MSDELKCPTCGSESVPTSVKAAIGEAALMAAHGRNALMRALETMYLYGETTKEPHWEKTMRGIVSNLSPQTGAALDDVGYDTVWRFFKAQFVLVDPKTAAG